MSNVPKWDVEKAVQHLQSHAHSLEAYLKLPDDQKGLCATYTRRAIEAGGFTLSRHNSAQDYGSSLEAVGFQPLPPETPAGGYSRGDVAVIEGFTGHPHGHIQMYDGTVWISDFKQTDFWPGKDYRIATPAFVVYRHQSLAPAEPTPAAAPTPSPTPAPKPTSTPAPKPVAGITPDPDVTDAVQKRTARFEGDVKHMYADTAGYVTVGIGIMLQSPAAAQALHAQKGLTFFNPSANREATPEDIAADWKACHDHYRAWREKHPKPPKGQKEPVSPPAWPAYGPPVTKLTVRDADQRKRRMIRVLNQTVATLKGKDWFPEWGSLPQSVREALIDMGYNLGTGARLAKYQKFKKAIHAKDWKKAAEESFRHGIQDDRNEEIKQLLLDAVKDQPKPPPPPPKPAPANGAGGGSKYLTEDATLQCICGTPVNVKGKGNPSWKINGSPVLTVEGLKQVTLACPQPTAGLGCTAIQEVVTGKAGKAKVRGQTPLLEGAMAITNRGGLVQVASPNPSAAKTGSAGSNGPPEKPPGKVHKPDKTKPNQVKFRLADKAGRPVEREWYRVTLPDGAIADGLLDADGRGAVGGFAPGGRCLVSFPNLKYARWFVEGEPEAAARTVSAQNGDTLTSVAGRNEMPRWQTLWDYPENVSLRRNRCEPERLEPGDAVCIPQICRELPTDGPERLLRLDQCHPLRTVTFRFVDATTGEPFPDLTVVILAPDGTEQEVTTDRYGEVYLDGQPGEVFKLARIARPGLLGIGDPTVFVASFRRSLDDLLEETMLWAVDPTDRGKIMSVDTAGPTLKPFTPSGTRTPRGPDLADFPLWDLVFPSGALDRVTDLTCTVPSHHGREPQTVCTSIGWDPAALLAAGQQINLTTEAKFQARFQWLEGGHVTAGANRLWPLEAKVDIGFQHVFAYQLDAANGAGSPNLKPVPDAVCRNPLFMPPLAKSLIAAKVGGGPVDIPVVRFRAVLVNSLVCNKPRPDFEPGGVMQAARVYPLQMLICSLPVGTAVGGVTLTRPATQKPHHPNMRDSIRPALFTDNNSVVVPDPSWNHLFAYYNVTNPVGTYTVAHRRTGPAKQLGWGDSQSTRTPNLANPPPGVSPADLEKVPGQGSYDNIHIAPPMFANPSPPDIPPAELAAANASFVDIAMAPFCVHDCFHTHWRWAGKTANTEQKGWSPAGVPYSTPGAPMVAANQEVTLAVTGSGFHYRADMLAPGAGEWQVVMHHGSAYSVAETSTVATFAIRAGIVAAIRIGKGWAPPGSENWPLFYWHLRFGILESVRNPFTGNVQIPGRFSENNRVVSDPALLAAAVNG